MKTIRILLTFIGNNDCYPKEKPGAILSILHQREFDKVYLLYNDEKYLKYASEILLYCRKHFPKLKVLYKETLAHNPIDYNTVYPAMYKAVKEILKENKDVEYTISLTSGTSTMHACWIFLQKGGVIDAKLIQVSRESGIEEVTFELDDFPKIQNVDEMKVEMTKLSRENINLKKQLKLEHYEIIGECPEMLEIKEQIQMLAQHNIPVLIQGESGTGKELVAEAIHYNSNRKTKNLVKVNCGAISPHLFESEFFGHKKGAFTGAIADRDGKFRQADEGTIFLDEIGDLPLEMQAKLLRILQDGTFIPVGADKEEKVKVRVISATNKDIQALVKERKFREDLYYRIAQDLIELPPLRERGNDKLLITENIIHRLNNKHHTNKKLDKSAIDLIFKYHWPGNIRQLNSVLERAFIYSKDKITANNMKFFEVEPISSEIFIPDEGVDLNNEILPKYYKSALKKANGNAEQAAKLLCIQPATFRDRLRKKGIDVHKFRNK